MVLPFFTAILFKKTKEKCHKKISQKNGLNIGGFFIKKKII